jgi:hypothetical protein
MKGDTVAYKVVNFLKWLNISKYIRRGIAKVLPRIVFQCDITEQGVRQITTLNLIGSAVITILVLFYVCYSTVFF